jgi:hypothetical protein
MMSGATIACALVTCLFSSGLIADSTRLTKTPDGRDHYSPYVNVAYPDQVYFGDTHLHTSQSFDAISFGTLLGPEEAYRFARGEEITSSTGVPAKLSRPLDFLVVADHAEVMGVMGEVKAGNPSIMADITVQKWHEMLKAGGEAGMQVYYAMVASVGGGPALPEVLTNRKIMNSIWEKNIDAAEKYNEPGLFTALIGYEWSSTTNGNNLHRVVIYRDGEERARQSLPFSSLTSDNPEDLWNTLKAYERKTGGKVLAIPHNGNLSNGYMFPLTNPVSGEPITREYSELRASVEPLYEVTQIKGDAETHQKLSKNDEFADYETWDRGNLDLSVAKEDGMLEYEYARSALLNGMKVEHEQGVNPFKFGMIGSTDAHTGLAAVEEDNFFGKLPHVEPSDHRVENPVAKFGDKAYMGYEMTSSGYAAVWATSNTRSAIWDAMKRREVYATTGPRMTVRFFGGWEFESQDAHSNLLVKSGYTKGVPMGGDLAHAPEDKSPIFLIAALKDPIGANLDRVQIIKGWIDEDGEKQEKIYDAICSDSREIKNGRCNKAVGNTVDVKNATWTNSIGESEMVSLWEDPDFDPLQRAFYYVRVLEIPTPRWTAYDAKRYALDFSEAVELTTQERSYTSPIWYTP